MSTRWMLATQPSHVNVDATSVLAEVYAFLIAIARRPTVPASDATDEEAADEHRPVSETAEEIAA